MLINNPLLIILEVENCVRSVVSSANVELQSGQGHPRTQMIIMGEYNGDIGVQERQDAFWPTKYRRCASKHVCTLCQFARIATYSISDWLSLIVPSRSVGVDFEP
jgi:hypothetical protein